MVMWQENKCTIVCNIWEWRKNLRSFDFEVPYGVVNQTEGNGIGFLPLKIVIKCRSYFISYSLCDFSRISNLNALSLLTNMWIFYSSNCKMMTIFMNYGPHISQQQTWWDVFGYWCTNGICLDLVDFKVA